MADRSVRVRLEAITANFNRRISESAVLTRRFSNELESADGRMSNIVQTALGLAPALVPIGAAGIPALAGLVAQLGFAALGTGALVLGLNGVGDALKALDTYQLEPTAEHLKKLHETLLALGPAGGEFVLFLDQAEPRFKKLRALAEQGLLPGVEDGIQHVLDLMPQLRDLTFNVSSTVGDLIAQAGDNLDDPKWREFFQFLQTEARPTLVETGKAAGNFGLTFANLVEAFAPLEERFSKGLLENSRDLVKWSDDIEQTTGFQELVAYVEKNGPRALHTIGAFGDALLQIVEAAAPVGSVALPILTDVLHVVSAIADTPVIGSTLIGLAAAIGIYGRSLALLKTVGLRGNEGLLASTFSGTKGTIKEASTALREYTTLQSGAIVGAKQLATNAYLAYGDPRIRSGIATLAKGAAVAGGFAVAQSGIADKVGLSNTASLGLIGTLGGPFGIAVGTATGFALDLAGANDEVEASLKRVKTAAQGIDFGEQRAALGDLLKKNKDLQKLTNPLKNPVQGVKSGALDVLSVVGFDPRGDAQKQVEDASKLIGTLRENALGLFRAVNGIDPSLSVSVGDDALTQFLTKISPALQRADIDVTQLLEHRNGWVEAQMAVKSWVDEMDSASGRSRAVGEALKALDDKITPTVDSAKALSDALDALFGPQTTQAEALNAFLTGLRNLRTELNKTGAAVLGNSETALKNQSLLIDQVHALQGRVTADAGAGVSGDKLVKTLLQGRQAIIDTAVAAGKSRTEVAKYLDTLGLAPANLVTIIETPGLLSATQKMGALAALYGATPAEIRTLIKQLNMDQSQTAIKALAKQYHLTPDQVRTVIRLINGDPVLQSLQTIGRKFVELDNKTLTIKARLIYEATHAAGGLYPGDIANGHMPELAGPGLTRVWREPETGGEAYIPLANDHRRAGAISIWERTGHALGVGFRRYAFGGLNGTPASGNASGLSYAEVADLVAGMRPLIGTQINQPHDYNEFRRQQDQNQRAAAIGGARRGGARR